MKNTEDTAAVRSLVILGGADGSVSTYHRARELGFRTICVDVRASAPAVALADEFVQVSVRAPEQIAAALDGRDDIAGVLCPASDVGLPALAWLTRHWNLPDPLPEAAVAASVDKSVFRELCDRLRLPTYRSVGGKPGPDLALAAQQLRFPTLVKPVDSSGSRGVVSCASPGGLTTAFSDSLAFSPSGKLVVEEHLDGSHYTIEALAVDGRIVFHAVTRRTLTPPPFFVTASHLLPAGLPPVVDRALPVMLAALCAELGYRTGPLTLDAVLGRDGKFYLIEMGARMGGNGLAEAIEHSTGVDLIAAGIAAATGGEVVLSPRDPRPTLIHILASDRGGRIVRIEGTDEVRAMPTVQNLELFAEEDSFVKPYEQAGYKMGYAVLSAPTVPEVLAAEDELRGTLKFLLDEQGSAVPLP
ncbi:ATP-grasp domain-containing protein [Amycolatopsis sp. NPDC102389]|uniref:ATP-grasp domain-containing protein n=1 Tax=Amycolatopsis sp. NPDC102389 TaxID=3363941 RepID=UPI00380064D4